MSGNNKCFRPPLKVKVSGGFILLFALLLFFDRGGVVAAAIPAVIVHELCHVALMRAFGARPVFLRASAAGLCLDYSGFVSDLALSLTALAGPAGGAIFALLCARAGAAAGSEYWLLSGGIGFVYSLFNLLPALPLDGGVAAEILACRLLGRARGERIIRWLGAVVSFLVIALGAALFYRGNGAGLLAAGIWLAVFQIKRSCK